ncbi:hypothetical protein ACO2Q3_13765 [Caulobacter sp. KR2-114]|uniref:hypothetical protein n=1 Tax=Caulobacter sp. KR2-114 TaxID=3400912 RepID=UPI003BFCEEFF
MGFELLPPLDPSAFAGLMAQDPGAYIDAQAQARQQQQQAITTQAQADEDRTKQQQAAQASAAAIHAVLTNPTPQNVAAAITLNPAIATQLKQAHDVLDAEQQKLALNDYAAVHGNLAAGRIDAAKAVLQRRIDADKARGTDTTDEEEMLAGLGEPGGVQAAQGMLGVKLASVIGTDAYGKLLEPEQKAATQAETGRHNLETEAAERDKIAASAAKEGTLPAGGVGAAQGAPASPAPTGGTYDQVAQIAQQAGASPDEQDYLRRLAYTESRGQPNARNGSSTGIFQFHPSTFAAAGGGNINDVGDQTKAALNLARADAAGLQRVGIAPTGANLYLMHQQGQGGGMALLSADPNANAVDALTPVYRHKDTALAAIAGNIGMPYKTPAQRQAAQAKAAQMTAGDFVNFWQNRWNGAPAAQGQTQGATQPQGQPYSRIAFQNSPGDGDLGSNPPDPDSVTMQAGLYLQNGKLPQLAGKYGTAWKTAILTEATKQAKALGLSPADIIAGTASIKASGAALQQAEKTLDAVKGSEGAVNANADLALRLMPQGAGTTGVPIFNRWQQHVRDQVFGDPNVSRFNLALKTVADEYAKVMSTTTGAGGAPTSDSARNEAYSRLANSATPEQLQANIATMKQEMANRINSLTAVRDGIQTRLRGGYGAGGAAGAPGAGPGQGSPPAPAPGGQRSLPGWNSGVGANGHDPIFTPEQAAAASKFPSNRGKWFYGTDGVRRQFH